MYTNKRFLKRAGNYLYLIVGGVERFLYTYVYLPLMLTYITRVEAITDAEIIDEVDTDLVLGGLAEISDQANWELVFIAQGGAMIRTTSGLKYYRWAYDASGNDNDLDGSATATIQPRLVGGIAPNSKVAAANQSGESRLFTHPSITVTSTYTLVKVLNTIGKNEVTFTEVTSGTLSELSFTGTCSFYMIYSGVLSTAQRTALTSFFNNTLIPEIESTVIGTQEWSTRNFEAVATPEGNVIQEMQDAVAVNVMDGYSFLTGWTLLSGTRTANSITGGNIIKYSALVKGKYYKFHLVGTADNSVFIASGSSTTGAFALTGTFDDTRILKWATPQGDGHLYISSSTGTTTFSTFVIEELGWANSTEIYDAVYAATAGTAAEKEHAALKEAAMWSYLDSLTDNGAKYGKLLNGYATKLFKADMLSAAFGWHPSTDAEWQLIDDSAFDLMLAGTDYWTTDNGTNSKGLTLLGGGSRNADGTFIAEKASTKLWVGDADKTVQLTDNSDTVTIAADDLRVGAYLRITED